MQNPWNVNSGMGTYLLHGHQFTSVHIDASVNLSILPFAYNQWEKVLRKCNRHGLCCVMYAYWWPLTYLVASLPFEGDLAQAHMHDIIVGLGGVAHLSYDVSLSHEHIVLVVESAYGAPDGLHRALTCSCVCRKFRAVVDILNMYIIFAIIKNNKYNK